MTNVLDLTDKDHKAVESERSPEREMKAPEPEPISPPGPEPPVHDGDPVAAAQARVKELLPDLFIESVSWKADIRPDALERRKEHFLLGGLSILGLLTALWAGSWALVGIVGLTVITWEAHHRTQEHTEVSISDEGIHVNGHRYAFDRLASFSVQKLPNDSWHLSLKSSSRVVPHIRAPLGEQEPEPVRAILTRHIAEEEHSVPISELFLKS